MELVLAVHAGSSRVPDPRVYQVAPSPREPGLPWDRLPRLCSSATWSHPSELHILPPHTPGKGSFCYPCPPFPRPFLGHCCSHAEGLPSGGLHCWAVPPLQALAISHPFQVTPTCYSLLLQKSPITCLPLPLLLPPVPSRGSHVQALEPSSVP